jgi:hypothetical protein
VSEVDVVAVALLVESNVDPLLGKVSQGLTPSWHGSSALLPSPAKISVSGGVVSEVFLGEGEDGPVPGCVSGWSSKQALVPGEGLLAGPGSAQASGEEQQHRGEQRAA